MRVKRVFLWAGFTLVGLALAAWGLGAGGAWGQQGADPAPREHAQHGPGHGKAQGEGKPEDEDHGPPEGWKFALPKGGDPARGRAVFVKFECFACHQVKGETFPRPGPGGTEGPELSSMAALHPPEFFAEAIINPGAVIDKGRGYEAPDGTSKMLSYNEDLTVQELVDLVAYLVSLTPPPAAAGAPPAAGHGH